MTTKSTTSSTPKTAEATPKADDKPERQWGMFTQAIVGRRLIDSDGRPVMKLALVSFPLPPGMEDKGAELIRMSLRREGIWSESGRIESFNPQGTLLGHMRRVDSRTLDAYSRKFESLYRAAGSFVGQNSDRIDEGNARNFQRFHLALTSRLGVLNDDVGQLLATPWHRNAGAWDVNFGGAFRQEMIYKDGKIYTLDPNNQMKEVNSGLVAPDMDFGHTDWMNWFNAYVHQAMLDGADGIMGQQVDATFSVGGCGGSAKSCAFYKKGVEMAVFVREAPKYEDKKTPEKGAIESAIEYMQKEAKDTALNSHLCPSCGRPMSAAHSCGVHSPSVLLQR